VFLKRESKLAEVRPTAKSLSLELVLPRTIDHPRISTSVDDVDDQVRDWLTDA